ncbi:hypothetical protein EDD85DRAFT_1022854 [Armillaria nabsnona]|nr:hypothetical protein EDD85DRAFT_1022854 [Armillaria nabsnona]
MNTVLESYLMLTNSRKGLWYRPHSGSISFIYQGQYQILHKPIPISDKDRTYCLNLKNLPYQTVYVEIPDVKALAKKIGAAPTSMWPDESPKYTIPIIQDHSTGAVISDSPAIAAYLNKTYPSSGPVLIPSGTLALQLAFTVQTSCPRKESKHIYLPAPGEAFRLRRRTPKAASGF